MMILRKEANQHDTVVTEHAERHPYSMFSQEATFQRFSEYSPTAMTSERHLAETRD